MFLEGTATSPSQLHIATFVDADADQWIRLIESGRVNAALEALRDEGCSVIGEPRRAVLLGHLRGHVIVAGRPIGDDYAVYSVADGEEFMAVGCSEFFADTLFCEGTLATLLESVGDASANAHRFDKAA